MSALVAPSGECLRSEGLVWLIGPVVCSLAAAAGPIVCKRTQWTANQLPFLMIVKHGWSGFVP